MEKSCRITVNAIIDYREIDALIHFHFENIRELIELMNDIFNTDEFKDAELIKIMRSISNEIELIKYYKGLKK